MADEFRFVHHAHRGGYVPDGLRDYLAQPHWVYIATFADASCKVGTAAHVRKRARLDEQGRSAKVAALSRPRSVTDIESAHHHAVEEARVLLARSAAELPLEPWQPPEEHAPFFTDGVVDPHVLSSGGHCLSVLGLIGGTALATLNEDDSPFVVDLGALKGRRVVPGSVRSPETPIQATLF